MLRQTPRLGRAVDLQPPADRPARRRAAPLSWANPTACPCSLAAEREADRGCGQRLLAAPMRRYAICSYPITNRDRTFGARLAGEIARRYGDAGLPTATLDVHLTGSAGQSFGAFGVPGMNLTLCGEANDYVGKGLAGGRIVIYPRSGAQLRGSLYRRCRTGITAPRRSWRATRCCMARPAARCSSPAAPASALRCATAARSPWWKAWATTAANT